MKNKDKNNELSGRIKDIYKVLVIGDPFVGKTELITQFVTSEFELKNLPTVGVNIIKVSIELSEYNPKVNLMFWDVAGQPQFYMLHRPYFNGADGVILVFDLTRSNTFSNVNNWWNSAVKYGLNDVPRILIGILKDQQAEQERKIILPMAEHLSEKLNAPYFEVSLDSGDNVIPIFQFMARSLLRRNIIDEMEAVKVRVEDSEGSYKKPFLCYLDEEILENNGLKNGDTIEIFGKKKTTGIVVSSAPDKGTGILRLDEIQRFNAGIINSENVIIRFVNTIPAQEIELTPITANIDLIKLSDSILAKIIDKPVVSGNILEVLGTLVQRNEPSGSITQVINKERKQIIEKLRLVIENTIPSNRVVKVTHNTRIKINKIQ